MPKKCIYCPKPIDGSREHIIPDSLNGRLTSKDLICSECNNKFGVSLDPSLKELFNPLLLLFNANNAKGMHIEGLTDEKYVLNKDSEVYPVKDEVTLFKEKGQTYLNVSGNPKTVLKTFGKQYKKLLQSGHKPLKCVMIEKQIGDEHLKFRHEMKISKKVILSLNKIATEFYAHCGLDISLISELLAKVVNLDESIDNTTICNLLGEIRSFNEGEISHLIVLKRDENNILVCYIELFNVLCVCIKLVEDYPTDIYQMFYQDAINGERIETNIEFNNKFEHTNIIDGDFDYLFNSLFDRQQSKAFRTIYLEGLTEICKKHKDENTNTTEINNEEDTEILIKKMALYLGKLTIYDFPYVVVDYFDEKNDELNYIHSNLREEQYEDFCKKYNIFIGKNIKIGEEYYVFNSFIKAPYIKKNGTQLIRVFCRLINKKNGKQLHLLYRKFFEGIKRNM